MTVRRALTLIVLAAIAHGLFFIWYQHPDWHTPAAWTDQDGYRRLGQALATTGKFTLDLRSIKNEELRNDQVKALGKNASAIACLSLTPAKRDEGDPENRLIALGSDRYPGNDMLARQENLISSFFGSEESIHYIQHNEALLEASRKAKAKLPALRDAFNAGLEPGEYIQLKAPFTTPKGGNEWMWIEVNSWKGDLIKGTLQNDPFEVPNLYAGQVVEVHQQDVFDYIRTYPDKHSEGNTTSEIILKMEKQAKTSSPVSTPLKITNCDSLP